MVVSHLPAGCCFDASASCSLDSASALDTQLWPIKAPLPLVCWRLFSHLPLIFWLVVALPLVAPPLPCVTFCHAEPHTCRCLTTGCGAGHPQQCAHHPNYQLVRWLNCGGGNDPITWASLQQQQGQRQQAVAAPRSGTCATPSGTLDTTSSLSWTGYSWQQ